MGYLKDLLKTGSKAPEKRALAGAVQRRSPPDIPPGTIDPFYECDLLDEIIDYAFANSIPWGTYDTSLHCPC